MLKTKTEKSLRVSVMGAVTLLGLWWARRRVHGWLTTGTWRPQEGGWFGANIHSFFDLGLSEI